MNNVFDITNPPWWRAFKSGIPKLPKYYTAELVRQIIAETRLPVPAGAVVWPKGYLLPSIDRETFLHRWLEDAALRYRWLTASRKKRPTNPELRELFQEIEKATARVLSVLEQDDSGAVHFHLGLEANFQLQT